MRKAFLATVLLAVPALLSAQTGERPDILFIAIDDMNDWISPLDGHPQAITPNMERLAERGVTFTNAHAPAVVCNATRTSFLSGLRSSTTGVYFNQNDWETNDVATSVRMLPGYFMDSGYRVMGTGKIFHSGHNDPTSWHGYYPAVDRERPDEATPRGNLPVNNNYFGGTTFDWGPIIAEDAATTDGQIADWMARYLNEPSDAPRFDAIGFRRPHQPWYVPEKYFDMHPLEQIKLPPIVEDDLDDVPDAALRGNFVTEGASIQGQTNQQLHEWVLESGQWPNAVQGNLASISFVDAMVGRVLDGLDASGRADNTIIVVFGANFGSGGSAVGDNAVSLSGDGMTLAVGAPYESSGSAGIDGDQLDESVFGAGAVYIFSNQDGEWLQQAYIKASNPGVTDNFGFATSLSHDGNTLAVSAHFESSAATGINGDQTDNSKRSAGAAYVFDRVGDTWAQSAYIKPSNPEVDALFGYSVAIDANGSRIAVGAYDEDGSLASTNEFQDGLIRGAGAVYVFDFDGDTWHQIEYLKPSNSERGDSFGVAVTISDDGKTVIATARDEDGPTSGINNIPGPDREDSTHPTTGAVYAFVQGDDGSWTQQAYIKASNTGSTDIFGSRLAVSGDGNVLVVGAQFEDSGAKGVGGDQSDNSVPNSGAVYLFRR